MILSDKTGCPVDNGHSLSHTCVAQDRCNPSVGSASNEGVSVGGQNHRQCQVGTAGSTLTFVLKQSDRCEALTTSPILLNHGSVTCGSRLHQDTSCSGGGNVGRECMWRVALPSTCLGVQCPPGQHPHGSECRPNCRCDNGIAETRPECNNEHDCFECNEGYHMSPNGKECLQNCYCEHGNAVDATVCRGGHQCESCDEHYELDLVSKHCVLKCPDGHHPSPDGETCLKDCYCDHGDAFDGRICNGEHRCESCDENYELDAESKQCTLKCPDGYHPSPNGRTCLKDCFCEHGDPFDGKICNGEHHCDSCDENYQLDMNTNKCKLEAMESMPPNHPTSFPELNVRLSAIIPNRNTDVSGWMCAASGMLFAALLSYGVRRYSLTHRVSSSSADTEPSLLSQGDTF